MNKFSIHGIDLADNGYYINLDSSIDRRLNVINQSFFWKINCLERFPGIVNEKTPNASCTESHLGVFKKALERNEEVIAVFEDDFIIFEECYNKINPEKNNVIENLLEIEKELKEVEWDVLLLGCNPRASTIPVSDHLAQLDKSTGAWSYIIKKRAYKYILENLDYEKSQLAIDDYLPMMNDMGFTTLCTIPEVVSHGEGFSILRKDAPYMEYRNWFNGNHNKHFFKKFENKTNLEKPLESYVTICIPGHFVEDDYIHLETLIKSLPSSLSQCKFLIRYDEADIKDCIKNHEIKKLSRFISNIFSEHNITIDIGYGGLISSLQFFLMKVKSPYLIFLEHDWVFLNENIDFTKLVEELEKSKDINAVWFSKNKNPMNAKIRKGVVNLLPASTWSNNPAIFRYSALKEWYESYIKNPYVGTRDQGKFNLEESIIPVYKNSIENNTNDKWGLYLYGEPAEGPFVGHTDASNRYVDKYENPEILGRKKMNGILNEEEKLQGYFHLCLSFYGERGDNFKVLNIGEINSALLEEGKQYIDKYEFNSIYVGTESKNYERLNTEKLDYVGIDAEGRDWKILKQLDLKKFKPKLVRYSFGSLTEKEKEEIKQWFLVQGYFFEISSTHIDSISIEALNDIRRKFFTGYY